MVHINALKYLALLCLLVGFLYLAQCGYQIYDILRPETMCGKTLGIEELSPSGNHKAVIYEFNCGAGDPFSTQISILSPQEHIPYHSGNVFGASRGERRGSWNGPYAEIEWKSPVHLVIKHIDDTNIHFKKSKVGDISVTYETL